MTRQPPRALRQPGPRVAVIPRRTSWLRIDTPLLIGLAYAAYGLWKLLQ